MPLCLGGITRTCLLSCCYSHWGAIILALLFINGTCLVYLQVTEGLDFSEAEKKLREGLDEAKRRALEAREQARKSKPAPPCPLRQMR